ILNSIHCCYRHYLTLYLTFAHYFFFFFFQAEDGIRDRNVTGVQTCALPILKIHETLPVDTSRVKSLQHNKAIPLLANCTELFSISDTYNFIMHPTKSVAIENEMGSVGPMDAT